MRSRRRGEKNTLLGKNSWEKCVVGAKVNVKEGMRLRYGKGYCQRELV